jgi:hypothetical protein
LGRSGCMLCGVFGSGGTNTESIKTPFLPHFHILLHYVHIMGDLPSNRFCEGLFLKRLSAVFWINNGILRFFLKPCYEIGNFMQPGMTISPERANPSSYRAPFDVGYLMSGMLITTSNTTSNLISNGVYVVTNPGIKQPLNPEFSP